MKKLIITLLIFFVTYKTVYSQQRLPVIRANSNAVDIKDDGIMMKAIWNITRDIKPDIYTIMRSKKEKRVTFYTDIDSISFDVRPNFSYDFIILLNNRDSCYTRITTLEPLRITYPKDHDDSIPDTIPFTLGNDNFIRIKGKINGSETLDMIFDTGAGTIVLTEKGLRKNVKMKFDGTTENIGSGGSLTQQTSSHNKVEIQDLHWYDVPIISIDYNGGLDADVVLGDNVFEGKILEINYDKSILVVHSSMPEISKQYSKNDMRYRTGQPFIEIALGNNKGWFLFDTGSKWAVSVNKEFVNKNKLVGTMENIGTRRAKGTDGITIKNKTVLLPKLMLGDAELLQVPIDLEEPSATGGLKFGILGNDVLKRFNVIIDFQNSVIYTKLNSLANAPYDKPFSLKKK